ncbi:sugar ABC transporter substrate-binding protein [Fervidobacterium thailandense]|uniref:Sugar ABC transporter substrate-binding protein n=1 Tax=Fervidobacterium thailandense TaxID=1008305 RepID=A0A1E3G1Q6_9BACT|nr:sugar ABC transporter substrate-binding protein [Fervidobacterium thailandense]
MLRRMVALILVLSVVFGLAQVRLKFWTAPNPLQEEFWKAVITEWNKQRPDIQIEVQTIPAAGSSEEAILTAIASGNAPDFSENIFSGFAAQLADIGALYPFDNFGADFQKLVETRRMKNIIEKWKIKGKYYVFPIYSNPMLFWWRGDLLRQLGYTTPPRTYEEIYELSKKFADGKKKFTMQVIAGRNWWDRWFDFITYYYAASGGNAYIDPVRRRVNFGDAAGEKVATFIYNMFQNKYTAVELGDNPFYKGVILAKVTGPWEINWALQTFPNVMPNVIITPPPVPGDYPKDRPIYTFADSKGIVIYNTCKNPKAVFEFLNWVFSNVQNDVLWIEKTKMPPAREDLATNPAFAKFMEDRFFKAYASHVPYAVPPALIDKTIDVQQAMTTYLIEPLMYLRGKPSDILKRAVSEINKLLF